MSEEKNTKKNTKRVSKNYWKTKKSQYNNQ